MRLLLAALAMILVLGFLGFVATNLNTTADVTVFRTLYPDVPLWLIVLSALVVMFVVMGVYAIAEGAVIRLENRRLRRELHKLETEINYLRTQPPSAARPEPDELLRVTTAGATPPGSAAVEPSPPSAPVYGDGDEDWSSDGDDDDAYSGGRAV